MGDLDMRDNGDLILLPDGIGHSPRVKEPESAMQPGMAAPIPREPDKRLFRGRPILTPERRAALPAAIVEAIDRGELTGLEWLALLASMPDTSMNNPMVPDPPPLQWSYDFNAVGTGRASFLGAVVVAGGLNPLSSGGIIGVADGSSAPAGTVGEVNVANGSSTALTTATSANITSGGLTLTPGDWLCYGVIGFAISVGATSIVGAISSTSATLTFPQAQLVMTTAAIAGGQLVLPPTRFNVSASTPIFVVAQSVFASGTVNATSSLNARRMR